MRWGDAMKTYLLFLLFFLFVFLAFFAFFCVKLDLGHLSAAFAHARELESYRHSHLHLGFLEDGRVVVSHDTIVHQVFDRIFSVDHFGAVLARNHEEGLVDRRGVDLICRRPRLQRLGQWVDDWIASWI